MSDPFAFGDSSPALAQAHRGTAVGRAALLQSKAVAAVWARMAQRGTPQAHLVRHSSFSERHLRRVLAGQQWARLTDLAELSDALEMDLLLVPGPESEDGKRSLVRLRDLGA